MVNFLKTHCLISDYVLGNVIHFVDKYATSIAFDTIKINNKTPQVSVYYLGTSDGKILKVSGSDSSSIISEWKLSETSSSHLEMLSEIKINSNTRQLYALTENVVYQVNLNQCEHHKICTTCVRDPYCSWNVNKNICQDTSTGNTNSKIFLNSNEIMCSSIQKQEINTKTINLEYGAHIELECNLGSNNYEYLFDFVEWKKDQQPIDFSLKSNQNLYLTWNKNILVLHKPFNDTTNNGIRENTIFSCFINNNELMSSYNLIYKQAPTISNGVNGLKSVQESVAASSSLNQSKTRF